MNSNDIAVIGMACVFPGAHDLKEYWSNLVNGVDAVTKVPPGRWKGFDQAQACSSADVHISATHGGFISDDFLFDAQRFGIMPNIVRQGDPDQFLMLHIIDAALKDAGLPADDPAYARTDVILGRGGYLSNKMAEIHLRVDLVGRLVSFLGKRYPGMSRNELKEIESQLRSTLPPNETDGISTCIPNLAASRAANRLNLGGAAYTVDAACASSLIAVEQAVQRLRDRRADLAIACGLHLCQVPPFWFVFTKLGALSPSNTIRPFDRRADGLLLGEGGGAVVLKRLDDAYRDNDSIYSVIKGVGSASDGREAGILVPAVKGQVEALARAYRDAEVDPTTVGFLEAHGTATMVGDAAEIETIKRFYGTTPSARLARAMGSVKSMIGHTMPAAGIASFIKTSLALSHKIMPPSLHCEELRSDLKDCPFYVNTRTRPWIHAPGGNPRRAGINAFGFGGINAHVVMEEVVEPRGISISGGWNRPVEPSFRRGSELLLFTASSAAALLQQLDHLEQFSQQDEADVTVAELAAALSHKLDFQQPCKLALVCRDRAHLVRLLNDARQCLGKGKEQTGDQGEIYYAAHANQPKGKLAFLFPGMAFPGLIGAYPDHLLELCLHYPEVRAELDKIEDKDHHPDDPIPFSSILAPPPSFSEELRNLLKQRVAPPKVVEQGTTSSEEPTERNLAGIGTTMSNWVGWLLLDRLGIVPDMVCGQSAGDLTALCVAGVLNFHSDVMPRLWESLTVPASYTSRGRLAFVTATEDELAPYLADLHDTHIAIHVGRDNHIVGGDFAEIDTLTARLRKDGILASGLPFIPGHTPRMSYLREQTFYAMNDKSVYAQPRLAVYSAISSQPFPNDGPGIRDLLLANLDHPVRFWQTNQRMYDDGARIFVQVGCGSLASNIKSNLPQTDVVTSSLDVEFRDPISQLNHLSAALFVSGITFRPTGLFEHRQLRPVDLNQPSSPSRPPVGALPLLLSWTPLHAPDQKPAISVGNFSSVPTDPLPRLEESPVAPLPASVEVPPAEKMCRTPFLGTILQYVPEEEIVVERVLDIEEDLYLRDHHFINAAAYKPIEECFPVMPMTMMMEMVAEIASCLAPGLGLIGFENIKASRWIGLDQVRSLTITVTGRRIASDVGTSVQTELRVNEEVYASAIVIFADQYSQTLDLDFSELANSEERPITAEALYDEGHMFHGPRFRCVSALESLGEEGLTGELTVLPRHDLFAFNSDPELLTDPVVLDGVGQLFGYWIQTRDLFALPVSVRKIEFYAPSPAPGTRLPVRVEITRKDFTLRTVTGSMEVQNGAGEVWMRIEGWTDWILRWSRDLMNAQRLPSRYTLARIESLPGLAPGSVSGFLSLKDLRHANLSWLARMFLAEEEMKEYLALGKERQRQFLLGRIAAKDAVRAWLAQQAGSGEYPHAAAFVIRGDVRGRPFAVPLFSHERMPEISIAHTEEAAVALATAAPAGIDLEPVSRKTIPLLPHFTRPEEASLIQSHDAREPGEVWTTRLWCAKEAAGKALGVGLEGRPASLQATRIDSTNGQMSIHHGPTRRDFTVQTLRQETMIVAYTLT